jgi:hypothetical protein
MTGDRVHHLLDPPAGIGCGGEMGLGEARKRGARQPSGEQADRVDLDFGCLAGTGLSPGPDGTDIAD